MLTCDHVVNPPRIGGRKRTRDRSESGVVDQEIDSRSSALSIQPNQLRRPAAALRQIGRP